MSITTTERLKELLPQLFSQQQGKGNYYLKFQLTDELNLLLDLGYVQESLTIENSQITALPNFPDYVMGLMSSRNQVFLALDLAHLAGFAPQTLNQRQYQTIIMRVDASQASRAGEPDLYGLSVKRIQGVSRILPEKFEPAPANAPEHLRPFLKGFVRDVDDGDRHNKPSEFRSAFLIDLPQLIASHV